jgi:hypothetical protein
MSVTGLSDNFSISNLFVGKETVGNTIIGITAGNVFVVSGKQAGVVNSWFSFTGGGYSDRNIRRRYAGLYKLRRRCDL